MCPDVSIIVTTYNVDPYIEKCLNDIVSQSIRNIEIIVVDDCSTDNTRDIIKSFALRDKRIKPIFLEENSIGGVATPANIGIDAAIGEYIGFADGDDEYEHLMFEKLYNLAKQNDADLAFCNYYILNEVTSELSNPADERRWLDYQNTGYTSLDISERKKILPFIAVPWRKLYRRELLGEEIRFPVGDYFYEDNPFHWFVLLKAESIAYTSEKLCKHRINRQGQTMSTIDERVIKMFIHHNTIYDWLVLNGLLNEYKLDLLRWFTAQMSWISEKSQGNIRKELFKVLRSTILFYDLQDIRDIINTKMIGVKPSHMLLALSANRYSEFFSIVDNGIKTNLFAEAIYEFQMHGFLKFIRIATNYVLNRTIYKLPDFPIKIRTKKEITLQDISIGLMLLESQMKNISDSILETNERIDYILSEIDKKQNKKDED